MKKIKCSKCLPMWGNLGLCKKHTPIHTIQHMGLLRFLWVSVSKNGRIIVARLISIFATVVVCTAIILVALYALQVAFHKQDLVSCEKLKTYSKTYSHDYFYITGNEKAMCDDIGIIINAPIKN